MVQVENEVQDSISPAVRKAIYWAYLAATLVIGSCQAYVAAVGAVQPDWITGALAVLAYAGALLGLQAVVYTPKTPVAAVKPVDDGLATIEPAVSENGVADDSVEVDYTSDDYARPGSVPA